MEYVEDKDAEVDMKSIQARVHSSALAVPSHDSAMPQSSRTEGPGVSPMRDAGLRSAVQHRRVGWRVGVMLLGADLAGANRPEVIEPQRVWLPTRWWESAAWPVGDAGNR